MRPELHLKIVYENNLDTDKFVLMFNNKTQSYKFYWFEAILNLIKEKDYDLTFDEVIDEMIKIPYGTTVTYNDISKAIAQKRGLTKMSAQAVGGAVGWNPICIIIPCHRVVGTNGSLTGYGGGIINKMKLLELEGVDITKYYVPKKGTAL